jgi:hypothetical protein
MAKLQLESEERMELVASLEALLGCVKSLHASVGDVLAEVVRCALPCWKIRGISPGIRPT